MNERSKRRGPGAAAPRPGRHRHHRPAAARLPRHQRLGAHRPVAGAADPGRVRRGVRRAGRARGRRSRSSAPPAPPEDHPHFAAGRAGRPAAGRGRLRGDHRRRPGRDGGRQQGRVARPAGSASVSASSCPSRPASTRGSTSGINFRYFFVRKTMFVKYSQGFVVAARRARHPRRAVRGADARPDRQEVTSFPIVLLGQRATGAAWSTGCATRSWPTARSRPADLDLLTVTDDVDEAVRLMVKARDGRGPSADQPKPPE